jgi:DNA mismatch repair protein MutL
MSASESELINEHKDTLSQLGFDIDQFGEKSWKVSAAPRLFQDRDIHQLLLEVLEDLAGDAHTQTIDMQTNALLSYLACRTAIKAGDVLTQNEMKRLIEKLTNTKTQYTCPHGRPVKVEMELKELYRLFKRK